LERIIDHDGSKAFSVRIAWACWRYAMGGEDPRFTIRDCIHWLQLLEKQKCPASSD
jgi:hypothetical protein